jgi:molybdopterin molybdotransferase
VLVFGLPGNPVSSLVCFELFVRPAIAKLAGRGFAAAGSISAQLIHAFNYKGGRAACLPARLTASVTKPDVWSVDILPWHGSADMATLARANGLVRLGTDSMSLEAGSMIDVLPV